VETPAMGVDGLDDNGSELPASISDDELLEVPLDDMAALSCVVYDADADADADVDVDVDVDVVIRGSERREPIRRCVCACARV